MLFNTKWYIIFSLWKEGDFWNFQLRYVNKNVSRRTIYNRIEKRGQLTTIKDGNKIYITAENMDVNYQVKASASEIKKITLKIQIKSLNFIISWRVWL